MSFCASFSVTKKQPFAHAQRSSAPSESSQATSERAKTSSPDRQGGGAFEEDGLRHIPFRLVEDRRGGSSQWLTSAHLNLALSCRRKESRCSRRVGTRELGESGKNCLRESGSRRSRAGWPRGAGAPAPLPLRRRLRCEMLLFLDPSRGNCCFTRTLCTCSDVLFQELRVLPVKPNGSLSPSTVRACEK